MRRALTSAILAAAALGLAGAESFRTVVAGAAEVWAAKPAGEPLSLSYVDSAVVSLGSDARFLRAVELEIAVPQTYLKHRGSVAVAIYSRLGKTPKAGVADLSGERIGFEPLQNKLQVVYQVPVRKGHGLKSTPYATVSTDVVPLDAFPILVRLMPVVKGLSDEVETLRFQLVARGVPIEEGAARISLAYPENLKDKPLTVLVDDEVVPYPARELLLKEGEHRLAISSEHYRNESRAFTVERARVTELSVELKDPTPVVILEAPENAEAFFDGDRIEDLRKPFAAAAGEHELRFRVGDYSLVERVLLARGKTYRIALSIDVTVKEDD